MAALVDTNVLVYRFDPRFPDKQRVAAEVLRNGIRSGDRSPAQKYVRHIPVRVTPVGDETSDHAAVAALVRLERYSGVSHTRTGGDSRADPRRLDPKSAQITAAAKR